MKFCLIYSDIFFYSILTLIVWKNIISTLFFLYVTLTLLIIFKNIILCTFIRKDTIKSRKCVLNFKKHTNIIYSIRRNSYIKLDINIRFWNCA